jgi:Ala-tRNA(Pro) deacylase
MATEKLIKYLDQNHVEYQMSRHSETFTAQETAANSRVKGRDFAKSVVVRLDGELALAVLPAHRKLDLKRLKQITGAKEASLADEEEFAYHFPDCTVGAMPPFGNLYSLKVIADSELLEDETIAFNAGNHTETMKVAARDFYRLVHPRMANIHRRPYRSRV